MDRGNQNFPAPESLRTRQDYGASLVARRNNLRTILPPQPRGAGPPNLFLEQPRLFPERATRGPLGIASIPGQRDYPHRMIYVDNGVARNAYQRQRPFPPEPSPSFQGRGNVQAPEEESRLTKDEQKEALNKLKKEVYSPMPKMGRRPNLYYREYSYNKFSENRKEGNEEGKRCAICLEDFEPREVVTVTPCKHMFHEDCISPWIKSQGRCPVCRFAICERLRENPAPQNNLTADEQYEINLLQIIRAMEEAFISENMRLLHPEI